jgi:hypothetical protein
MSYDLLVFEPSAVPLERAEFFGWYHRLTEWPEGPDYNDPANSTAALQSWYQQMIQKFPAMNGPDGVSDDNPALETGFVTGYTCAGNAIYLDFRWNIAQQAYFETLTSAAKHHLGFFDVSAEDGAVWLPTNDGYRIAHGGDLADRETERAIADWLSEQHSP